MPCGRHTEAKSVISADFSPELSLPTLSHAVPKGPPVPQVQVCLVVKRVQETGIQ